LQALAEFPRHLRQAVRGVFCDIDDTLTTEGRLTAEAYGALERLQRAGCIVVPVTGRPAGWCDHIARMWPVDAVVGENGAFYFRYDRGKRRMNRRFVDSDEVRAGYRTRLAQIAGEILAAVPGTAVAADQQYRESDLAIDFREDVTPLPESDVQRIVEMMQTRGLTAKVSSIHVNGWFGTYDKLTMTRTLMLEAWGVDLDVDRGRYVFVGDSPNDAPMFEYFPHAIGVANVSALAPQITHLPAYITRGECGAGFREAADCLLAARAANGRPE
jgi:HAD superfamily hydrolase (TIGR01484 family)